MAQLTHSAVQKQFARMLETAIKMAGVSEAHDFTDIGIKPAVAALTPCGLEALLLLGSGVSLEDVSPVHAQLMAQGEISVELAKHIGFPNESELVWWLTHAHFMEDTPAIELIKALNAGTIWQLIRPHDY